ncbi:MAG: superinfection immunity protein [Gammaproteobacteria bacterium]|nr:superinfection immunity protein [Gammaproteobacteria bacterium]
MSDQMYVLALAGGTVCCARRVVDWWRLHPHAAGIAVLNVFLGWTVFGWVAALVSGVRQAASVAEVELCQQ